MEKEKRIYNTLNQNNCTHHPSMTSIHSLRKPSGDSEPFRRSHLQGRGDRMEWLNKCTNAKKVNRNIIFKIVPWLKARKSNRSGLLRDKISLKHANYVWRSSLRCLHGKKSQSLTLKRYKNGTTLHADIFCHHENCENHRSLLHQ